MAHREGTSIGLTRRQWCVAVGGSVAAGRSTARGTRHDAAALPLAQDWVPGTDPTGWLVSEKFDGVRALWDGSRLWFRSGRPISAPAWFTARLPATPLDGELWLARGGFETLSGIVRSSRPDDAAWRRLSYQVFELPGGGGTFAERAARLSQIAAAQGFAALQAVAQQPVADAAALQRRLDAVVADGGEGLVLHHALAPEVSGRTPLLCKYKPQQDAEAVVVEHLPGRGRLAGQTGALLVQADDGRRFQLGSGLTDAQRATPPAIGRRVTYAYQGLTAQGLPRFASFVRLAPAF